LIPTDSGSEHCDPDNGCDPQPQESRSPRVGLLDPHGGDVGQENITFNESIIGSAFDEPAQGIPDDARLFHLHL